jgi:hypothetical protein
MGHPALPALKRMMSVETLSATLKRRSHLLKQGAPTNSNQTGFGSSPRINAGPHRQILDRAHD